MSTPIFSFTEDPFENGTKGSYKKMNIISADTDSKLYGQQGNPLILALYNYFHPIQLVYTTEYSQWKSKKAAYHGATVNVYKLLSQLSGEKIEDFDIRIQVVYKRDTAEYAALFPDFRAPFQTGEIDERISAINTLLMNIGTDPALAAVKLDTDAFFTLLKNARNNQQALEGESNTLSAELELQRVVCAHAMYYVLGGLMQIFSNNPLQIADFFDLETLRGALPDDNQLIFDGVVNSGQVFNIFNPMISQFVAGVTLKIKNTTTDPVIGPLYFYPANNPGDGWNGQGEQLNPGQEVTHTITAAEFKAYFNVQNQGPNTQSFEVTIL